MHRGKHNSVFYELTQWLQNCNYLRQRTPMRIEKTVLLIDDDKEDLEMLEEALKAIDEGHKTIQAGDGIEGLKMLQDLQREKRLPCLIVLDINMPKMDGNQTFVTIRSNETLSNIPIVIFSTSSSSLDRIFFERYNTAYFVKPVDFKGLVTTASKMMDTCYHRTGKK
jgi:DNA-binding response OmpR family regulator